ncbi:MAG: hypothetical protein AB7N80_13620 [Bdellovibrionales bacterium]
MNKFISVVLALVINAISLPTMGFAQGVFVTGGVEINRTPPLPPQPRPPRPPVHRPPPQRPPPHRPPPQRPPPYNPPPQPPRYEEVTRSLMRLYVNESIDLDALFGLNRWYRGYTVDYVTVRISNADPRLQELTLRVNGYTEDRIRPYGYVNDLAVHGWKEVGREISWIDLFVSGQVEIQSITVRMTRNW